MSLPEKILYGMSERAFSLLLTAALTLAVVSLAIIEHRRGLPGGQPPSDEADAPAPVPSGCFSLQPSTGQTRGALCRLCGNGLDRRARRGLCGDCDSDLRGED